jgi:F1F0 ATPase subunit 2
MNETLLMPLFAGLLLGTIFYTGLWWTVQRGVESKTPALWFVGSLLLRTAIVLSGFYLISNGEWRRIAICFLGFFVARIVITLLSGTPIENRRQQPVIRRARQ